MAIPESTDHTKFTETWMLFESGNGVVVDPGFFFPHNKTTRPIDAWLVIGDEGVFNDSARRAALAVYQAIHHQGVGPEPVVVGFELQGLPVGRAVTGESGGLAFAIALAKRLLGKDPGPVAATGHILSSHGGGPIGPVRGIEAKLQAAARLVPEKASVFYPKENDGDIPEALLRSLKEKGLKLYPVSSVAEALDVLFRFPEHPAQKGPVTPKSRHRLVWGSLTLALVCVALLALLRVQGWLPSWSNQTVGHKDVTSAPAVSVTDKDGITNKEAQKAAFKEERDATNKPPKDSVEKDDAAKVELTAAPTGKDNITVPTTPVQPEPALRARPEIKLKGNTAIASRLAQLTTQRLEGLISREKGFDPKGLRITGDVAILGIIEKPKPKEGGVTASITFAARELRCVREGRTNRSLPALRVTVEGMGPATTVLPAAASALAEEIVKAMEIKGPAHEKPGPGQETQIPRADHGFE